MFNNSSKKEEFLTKLNLLKEKISNYQIRPLILHEIGHLFWMKDTFNISKDFTINLIDLYDTISKLSIEEQNFSEKNALLYEISLCKCLGINPLIENIPRHIMMNYKGEWISPQAIELRSIMLYDEICSLSKNISLDTKKEHFMFADDIITKWLSTETRVCLSNPADEVGQIRRSWARSRISSIHA